MLHTTRNILRLWRKHKTTRFNHNEVANGATNEQSGPNYKEFKTLLQRHKDKIVFNSYLEKEKLRLGVRAFFVKNIRKAKEEKIKSYNERTLSPLPLSLQYYVEKDRLIQEDKLEKEEPDRLFHLPFSKTSQVSIDNSTFPEKISEGEDVLEYDRSNINKWMTNYELFDDTKIKDETEEEIVESDWYNQYGTPDPTIAISRVPCGGCGALLHCNDPAIPGYLPSELFKGRKVEDLKTMECQRCHFLKEYNIALDITVQPEEYEQLLQSIRYNLYNITKTITFLHTCYFLTWLSNEN